MVDFHSCKDLTWQEWRDYPSPMESKLNSTNACQDNPFSAEEAVGTESNRMRYGRSTFIEDWKAAEVAVAEDRRRKKGDLYFVKVGRFLKIGHTTNLAVRMRMIHCHAPLPPELIGTVKGGGHQERDWHRRFAHLQSNREAIRKRPILAGSLQPTQRGCLTHD